MDLAAHIPTYQADVCSVASWVTFGVGCVVHDFAVVGRVPSRHGSLARVPGVEHRLVIGAGVEIGCHAVLYAGCEIGDETFIGDAACVREDARVGRGCVIGRQATVSYGAVLGDNVRMVDGAFVTDGARVGSGTFIGVGVVMMSDKRREVVEYEYREEWVTPPVIGERCLIGSGAVILPGVTIGDDAVIGAGALVTKDVPTGGTVLGQPARLVGDDPVTQLREIYRERLAELRPSGCMTGKVA